MEHLLSYSITAIQLVLIISGPVLIASLITGLGISLLQSMTQIQDFTLSFVPKLIVVSLVLALTSKWIGAQILRFTIEVWSNIPR